MKQPIYVRPLTEEERQALKVGLRSKSTFTLRRCQILLASAKGKGAREIAETLQCVSQTVRNAIHEFHDTGLASLKKGSTVPLTIEPVLTAEKRERMREILHQSPRLFGKTASVWTLSLLAEVCHEQGLSETVLSDPTMLDAIRRLGVRWQRAKQWITSPDPDYARKKDDESG